MSTRRDFYEILSVERTADGETIKKAYRKLAMQHHPDKNPDNQESEDLFKEAAYAYEILSNAEKRALYDRHGHAAFANGGRGGHSQNMDDIFSSFGDIFGEFFGGGGGRSSSSRSRSGPRPGADLRYMTEITLKDVITGLEKDIEFDTEDSCAECKGSGAEKDSTPERCGTCGGSGQIVRAQGFFSMASPCTACGGRGVVVKNPCKSCKGRGRVKQHRRIRLNIPAGVDNGTRLRVGKNACRVG